MSNRPTIAVIGATSKQGGSIVRSLIKTGRYNVRALTRNGTSADAKKLEKLGAEIFVGDSSKKEDLRKAFQGVQGVFAMTPVMPPAEEEREQQLGKLFADVAVEKGVKHLVWSSLENVETITNGKLKVPHFTAKAKAQEYIEGLKADITVTSVILAFFYTNVIEYYVPQKDSDGTLTFSLPCDGNLKYPFLDPTTAAGPIVLEIFDHPEKYSNKSVPIVSDIISPNEMIQQFTKVTGIKAKFHTATEEEWFKLPFPKDVADEIWQMWVFAQKDGYYHKDRDLELSRKLNPSAWTWEQFLKNTGWKGESFQTWKETNVA